jgi:hypothetical protein
MTEYVNHHWFIAVGVINIAVFSSRSNDQEDSLLNVQLGNRFLMPMSAVSLKRHFVKT